MGLSKHNSGIYNTLQIYLPSPIVSCLLGIMNPKMFYKFPHKKQIMKYRLSARGRGGGVASFTSLFMAFSLCKIFATSYDITNRVYNLGNNYCASSYTGTCGGGDSNVDTYYATSTQTWSTFGANFTQDYGSKTLIFGNSTSTPKADSKIWFGAGGSVGYIVGNFSAGNIFLTGVIGSGNSIQTGGGATLNFTASNQLIGDGLTLNVAGSGTQNSYMVLSSPDIILRGSSTIQIANSGGVEIGSDGSGKVDISDTSVSVTSGTLKVQSADTRVQFQNMTMDGGTIYIKDGSDVVFNLTGAITNGYYENNRYNDDDNREGIFTADYVRAGNDSQITAHNIDITQLEIRGKNGNQGDTTIDLNGGDGTTINISELMNADYIFGQIHGYTATLNTNTNTTIGSISVRNYTGGNTLNINTSGNNTLYVQNVNFITDGIAGSQATLNLNAQDGSVIVDNIAGCTYGCTGGQGIRPLNSVNVNATNFYGGYIQAVGLPTAGSDSVLNLSGVTGTTFLSTFEIRTGTLIAQDFHINNFTVWKSNSWSAVKGGDS